MNRHRIKEKLKQRSGASLLLAMVIFLAATMVSVVIVSTSLTALKRVHDDRMEKINYLSVNSAARLVEDSLGASSIVVEKTGDSGVWGDPVGHGDCGQMLDHLFTHAGNSNYSETFDIDFSDSLEASSVPDEIRDSIKPCRVTLSMSYGKIEDVDPDGSPLNNDFKITGVIATAERNEDGTIVETGDYKVYVEAWITRIDSETTTVGEGDSAVTTTTATIVWGGPNGTSMSTNNSSN